MVRGKKKPRQQMVSAVPTPNDSVLRDATIIFWVFWPALPLAPTWKSTWVLPWILLRRKTLCVHLAACWERHRLLSSQNKPSAPNLYKNLISRSEPAPTGQKAGMCSVFLDASRTAPCYPVACLSLSSLRLDCPLHSPEVLEPFSYCHGVFWW